jgi:hypothetical protein
LTLVDSYLDSEYDLDLDDGSLDPYVDVEVDDDHGEDDGSLNPYDAYGYHYVEDA